MSEGVGMLFSCGNWVGPLCQGSPRKQKSRETCSPVVGEVTYGTPGAYIWTAPECVSRLSAVCVGGEFEPRRPLRVVNCSTITLDCGDGARECELLTMFIHRWIVGRSDFLCWRRRLSGVGKRSGCHPPNELQAEGLGATTMCRVLMREVREAWREHKLATK
jgi:hypothetical protein